MGTATTIAHSVLRITAVVQIVLGLLFWTGNALNLIPIHMLSGLILVLSLWILAILAALAGANRGFVVVAIIWGIIVPALGFTQAQILPGPAHWVIEVIHLVIGMAAIGMGERLARHIKEVGIPAQQAA